MLIILCKYNYTFTILNKINKIQNIMKLND